MDKEKLTPAVRMLTDFLFEEEANISRKKIISVGTLLALATILLTTDALAGHGSHGSHGSHSSHSSGSGGHYSHVSHTSHTSATDHGSHASGHSSHSNSHASHASHGSASHASHSSANIQHSSHASAAYTPSHSNSGVSEVVPPQADPVFPEPEIPDGVIDIRVPLTPPDSPSSSDLGG